MAKRWSHSGKKVQISSPLRKPRFLPMSHDELGSFSLEVQSCYVSGLNPELPLAIAQSARSCTQQHNGTVCVWKHNNNVRTGRSCATRFVRLFNDTEEKRLVEGNWDARLLISKRGSFHRLVKLWTCVVVKTLWAPFSIVLLLFLQMPAGVFSRQRQQQFVDFLVPVIKRKKSARLDQTLLKEEKSPGV